MYGKLIERAFVVSLIIFCMQCSVFGGEPVSDKKNNANDSSSVQAAVNKDKDLLKKLMMPTRTPDPEVKDLEFQIGDNPVEGSSSAQLIMVQFSDYSCGHCALYTKDTYPEIHKEYIDTGKLRYVIIDYPLPGNTPAIRAAEAVHCAADQGKFHEMHEEMMLDQESLLNIEPIASFVELDMVKFKECMETKKYAPLVNENILLGIKLKIPSVPNFIIARVDAEDSKKVKGISYIRGAKSFAYFKEKIDKALEELDD